MKANLNVFCPPKQRFSVGDCAIYSYDNYDDVPYVHTSRDWGRIVITGSIFVPLVRPREYYRAGWWYSSVIFDAPDDAMIGHNCGEGELIHESEIRLSNKAPSVGFLAFLGFLWLPTEEAARVLGISSKSLNRKRKSLSCGTHYLESNKHYSWNVGQVAKDLKITIAVPEIERSNQRRQQKATHRNDDYGPFKGVFPVPTPDRPSIIVPPPPLCG